MVLVLDCSLVKAVCRLVVPLIVSLVACGVIVPLIVSLVVLIVQSCFGVYKA